MANVLIVDDDLDILALSAVLLESAGHRVQTGNDGEEGLVCLSSGPLPDCVLMDVDMPVLSGTEMAHRMLIGDADEETIPIVVVSARVDLPEIARRIGTPYFLSKTAADYGRALLTLIERALSEQRAPAAA